MKNEKWNKDQREHHHLLQGHRESDFSRKFWILNNLFAHLSPGSTNSRARNHILPIRPCCFTGLQPLDHISKQFRGQISPATALDHRGWIMQLMDSTMRFPSAVAQKLHLEPSSRQAPKTIPNITHNAAERHLLKVNHSKCNCAETSKLPPTIVQARCQVMTV